MYRVSQEIDFCYGHRLLNYAGKCRHLHGHNGKAVIVLEGESLDERGMLIDFGDIKRSLCHWIDAELDHRMILREDDPAVPHLQALKEPLVLIPHNPTAENIARLIFEHARSAGMPVTEVSLVGKRAFRRNLSSLQRLKTNSLPSDPLLGSFIRPVSAIGVWMRRVGSRYFLRGTFSLGSQCVGRWQSIAAIFLLIVSSAVSADGLDAVPRAEWNRRQPGERSDHLERQPEPPVEDEAARFRLVEPHRRRFARFRHLLFGLRHRRNRLRPDRIAQTPSHLHQS